MAKAVRITPEQYLALGDLGVPVYANDRLSTQESIAGILMNGGDKNSTNRGWWAARMRYFWTLVDG